MSILLSLIPSNNNKQMFFCMFISLSLFKMIFDAIWTIHSFAIVLGNVELFINDFPTGQKCSINFLKNMDIFIHSVLLPGVVIP